MASQGHPRQARHRLLPEIPEPHGAAQELQARARARRVAGPAGWPSRCAALGLEVELTPVEGRRPRPTRSGRLSGRRRRQEPAVQPAHIDTNPVTEGWTVDPWGGKVDDKFIYGNWRLQHEVGRRRLFSARWKTLIDAGREAKGRTSILTYVVGRAAGRRRHGGHWSSKAGAADYFVNSEADRSAGTHHACGGLRLHRRAGGRHAPPSPSAREAVDALGRGPATSSRG